MTRQKKGDGQRQMKSKSEKRETVEKRQMQKKENQRRSTQVEGY